MASLCSRIFLGDRCLKDWPSSVSGDHNRIPHRYNRHKTVAVLRYPRSCWANPLFLGRASRSTCGLPALVGAIQSRLSTASGSGQRRRKLTAAAHSCRRSRRATLIRRPRAPALPRRPREPPAAPPSHSGCPPPPPARAGPRRRTAD